MRSQALHIYCSVADDTSIELAVRRTVLQLQLINLILQHNCFLAPTDSPISGKNKIIPNYSRESRWYRANLLR